ncbi:MAG: DUF2203 domain-containing protein [Nitrospinaceae bacterium]
MPSKKYFTLEEANSFIPRLMRDVPRIQSLAADMVKNYPDVKKAWEKHKYNGGSFQGIPYLRVALKVNKIVNDLEATGCVLKGINEGLVDFPSLRDGREVYLCWKVPETKIQYWHDMDSGYAGRQRI